ncbi:hypothetical protein [Streptomyces bluensis]|uniref:hypothetical protein n=1 Tax=Streptomyces bluensis TaxID=33897 RepID=UPI00167B5386|nr:hypothetical protein [Streptomyces bluensis]GGZ40035.1 hypothetical protein GCM10010344_00590 [Streptomyces bluensis]
MRTSRSISSSRPLLGYAMGERHDAVIDRTMSYARLVAKLERYDAYGNAPATGRGNAARTPRPHWQETYSGSHAYKLMCTTRRQCHADASGSGCALPTVLV